jgi:hypothetical protein
MPFMGMKKPGDVGASVPADANLHRNNTTKEQIVSMLEQLLKCCGEDVVALEPQYNARSELETIKVTFLGGGTRYANVYADSHLAICRDVLNQVFV